MNNGKKRSQAWDTKKKFNFLLLLFAGLAIGLSACSQADTPPENLSGSSTSTILAETPTDTLIPSVAFTDTPKPTFAPTTRQAPDPSSKATFVPAEVDFTQLSEVGVGQIGVYNDKKKAYLVIDLDNQRAFFIEGPPEGCLHFPIPGTTELNCLSAKPPFTYNLLLKEMTFYPQGTEEILLPTTADTGALISRRSVESGWVLSVLEPNGQTVARSVGVDVGGEFLPSPDFRHILAKSDSQIGLIDWQTGEFRPVSASDEVVTDNLDWAPNSKSFIYGTMGFELEIGLQADRVYLFDMESQTTSILATPPVPYRAYNEGAWPVWSPDSERAVLVVGNYLCVVHVENRNQQCTEIIGARMDNVMSIWPIRWSPDSRKIAFVTHIGESPKNTLMIYDIVSGSLARVVDDDIGEALFWIDSVLD